MDQSLAKLVAKIDPARLEEVIGRYVRREIGLSKGAALLDLHIMDFQAVVGERRIDLAYTSKDLDDDVETLRRGSGANKEDGIY